VSPSDILDEVSYFGQGGGPFCEDDSYPAPKVVHYTQPTELMYSGVLTVCGWKAGEKLTGSVRYPDGKTINIRVENRFDGVTNYGILEFTSTLSDPPGDYVFMIKGKTATLQKTIRFNMPDGPRIYRVETNRLLLYGFKPHEKVRLFCYVYGVKTGFKLVGWQKYAVDSRGQLDLKVPEIQYSDFIAIGEKTGEAHILKSLPGGGYADTLEQGSIVKAPSCGSLKSRLHKGGPGRITITDGTKTRIREKAGFTQKILDLLPEGIFFNILDGPVCVDQSIWWQVRTKSGRVGWMAEYQKKDYLLEPIPLPSNN
jgi:hypothetical protein